MESIAVFIDADNISWRDAGIIMGEIKGSGRIISCNVYGDWSNTEMSNWLSFSRDNGLTPVQCDMIKGKNSTDIRLMVDIMEYLYTIPHITMFYIVTSDSDYRHVIPKLKLRDKKVYCIGNDNANISLKASCDNYTAIELLRRLNEQEETNAGEEERKNTVFGRRKRIKVFKEICKLSNSNPRIDPGLLNDMIKRNLGYDYREFGFVRFIDLLREYYSDKLNFNKNSSGTISLTIKD